MSISSPRYRRTFAIETPAGVRRPRLSLHSSTVNKPIPNGTIDIGRLSPAFPVTPPYMRVRIRRFRDLSQRPEIRNRSAR